MSQCQACLVWYKSISTIKEDDIHWKPVLEYTQYQAVTSLKAGH